MSCTGTNCTFYLSGEFRISSLSSEDGNTYSEITAKHLATYKHGFSVVACNSIGVAAENKTQRRNLILK
jgi:hypothetical protein